MHFSVQFRVNRDEQLGHGSARESDVQRSGVVVPRLGRSFKRQLLRDSRVSQIIFINRRFMPREYDDFPIF